LDLDVEEFIISSKKERKLGAFNFGVCSDPLDLTGLGVGRGLICVEGTDVDEVLTIADGFAVPTEVNGEASNSSSKPSNSSSNASTWDGDTSALVLLGMFVIRGSNLTEEQEAMGEMFGNEKMSFDWMVDKEEIAEDGDEKEDIVFSVSIGDESTLEFDV
jgi:hypothetical protein